MRKYFLLSAAALLAASAANATTDYAEVTARATIEVAGTFSCSNMDFGTIVVKQNNEISVVSLPSQSFLQTTKIGDIISVSDSTSSICDTNENISVPPTVTLSNGTDTLSSTVFSSANIIYGSLSIPANVKAGEYTGSFTATITY